MNNNITIFEEIVELGYRFAEELTRKFHNQHNMINGIDCLENYWNKLLEEDKDIFKKYFKELKKEIVNEINNEKYINILFKRMYDEINNILFGNNFPFGITTFSGRYI